MSRPSNGLTAVHGSIGPASEARALLGWPSAIPAWRPHGCESPAGTGMRLPGIGVPDGSSSDPSRTAHFDYKRFFLRVRHRPNARARCFNDLGLVRLLIGEPLARSATNDFHGALGIGVAQARAAVVPEIKLRQIAEQMRFSAVLIHATHTALEH